MRTANEENREKFIRSAVMELEEHGASDFSIRRVARRCGLSSAAPYKHFHGREELILEVVRYINRKWETIRDETVDSYAGASERDAIVSACMAYITFLCTYPEYQMILFMNDRVFPVEVAAEKGKLSTTIETKIADYCRSVAMPEDVKRRKQLIICSLLCGAAEMINSGAVPFDSHTMSVIRATIEREFELQ